MIKVVYHKGYNRLTVTGHAYSGEAGHDIVCASASILAYTLAVNVETLVEAENAREPTIRLDEGNAEVSCKAIRRYKDVVKLIFSAICSGFALLANQYPDNISYEARG